MPARRIVIGVAAALAVTLVACYQPTFDPCAVTCQAATGCPTGYVCGASNHCYPTGTTEPACAAPIDAAVDAPDPDAMIEAAALQGLATGAAFTCGRDAADRLLCWGDNRSGQLGRGGASTTGLLPMPVIGAVATWSAVVAGEAFACGIARDSGAALCWGNNQRTQLGRGPSAGEFVAEPGAIASIGIPGPWTALTAGSEHACGINAGRLFCWGGGGGGQLGDGLATDQDHPVQVGTATDWVRVSAGISHTCGVRDNGATRSLYCWGAAAALGQAPTPTGAVLAPGVATLHPSGMPWIEVAAGNRTTCAIDADRALWCWGDNWTRIIASSANAGTIEVPLLVDAGPSWDQVSVGRTFACGRAGTEVWCWGASDVGQAGVRVASWTFVGLTPIAGSWTAVVSATTGLHGCAVRTGGGVACWGYNSTGQLGTGVGGDAYVQQQVIVDAAPAKPWHQVIAGLDVTCAIAADDRSIWCWGLDTGILRGLGDQGRPRRLDELGAGWSMLDLDTGHACAIKTSDQSLWCWGDNGVGQLGNGSAGAPAEVVGGGQWLDVGVGTDATCAVKADGTLWCWGNDDDGLLGDPASTVTRTSPHQVIGVTNDWRRVSVGETHACAVRAGGTAACWGSNQQYAVDDQNLDTLIQLPTDLPMSSWVAIDASTASGAHSAGISGTTRLAWGSGYYGRLGLDIIAFPVSTPTSLVAEAADWEAVANGGPHGCGLRNGGQLWCWGYNYSLPLATGNVDGSYVPVQLGAAAGWRGVSAGYYHSCAIDAQQRLWCWGQNNALQIGAGLGMSPTPVPVVLP